MAGIEHTPVTSSNIVSHGYDPATKVMEVTFRGKNGNSTYSYADVPQDVWERFKAASSKGSFHHENVKGRFSHSKV